MQNKGVGKCCIPTVVVSSDELRQQIVDHCNFPAALFCESDAVHKIKNFQITGSFFRATDGVRTRDPDLGKVVLYQLSHCRISMFLCSVSEQYILYYKDTGLSTVFKK